MKGPVDGLMDQNKPGVPASADKLLDTSQVEVKKEESDQDTAHTMNDQASSSMATTTTTTVQSSTKTLDVYEQDLPGEVLAPPEMKKESELNHFEKKEKKRAEKNPEKKKAFEEKMLKKAYKARGKETAERVRLIDKMFKDAEKYPIDFSAYSAIQEKIDGGIESLNEYTGDGYKVMNNGLRFGSWKGDFLKTPDHTADATVKALKALNLDESVVSRDVIVRRDMDPKGLFALLGMKTTGSVEDDIKTMLAMDHLNDGTRIVHDKGFFSTTFRTEGDSTFMHGVEMKILVPKGTHALTVEGLTRHRGEFELLLQANTKHRLLKVERKDEKSPIVVYLEAIPGNVFDPAKIDTLERMTH